MERLSPYHFIHGDCHVMDRSYLYFSHRRLSFQIFLHTLRKCDVLIMCRSCRCVHLGTDATDVLSHYHCCTVAVTWRKEKSTQCRQVLMPGLDRTSEKCVSTSEALPPVSPRAFESSLIKGKHLTEYSVSSLVTCNYIILCVLP